MCVQSASIRPQARPFDHMVNWASSQVTIVLLQYKLKPLYFHKSTKHRTRFSIVPSHIYVWPMATTEAHNTSVDAMMDLQAVRKLHSESSNGWHWLLKLRVFFTTSHPRLSSPQSSIHLKYFRQYVPAVQPRMYIYDRAQWEIVSSRYLNLNSNILYVKFLRYEDPLDQE